MMKIEDFLNMPNRAVIATFYIVLAEDLVVNGKEDLWKPFVKEGDQATLGLVDDIVLAMIHQNTAAKKARYLKCERANLYSVDVVVLNPLCVTTHDTAPYDTFLDEFKRNEAPLGMVNPVHDAVVYIPSQPSDMRRELTLLDPANQVLSCRFVETLET
jgi:hypothetical protein